MRKIILFISIFSLLLVAKPTQSIDEFGNQIIYTIDYKLKSRFKSIVSQLYRKNGYRPLWIDSDMKVSSVLNALNDPILNYKNRNFNKKEIKELSFAIDNGDIPQVNITKAKARLDVMITDGFLRLLNFVRVGEVDWAMVQRKLRSIKESQDVRAVWEMRPKKMPSTKSLYSAIKRGDAKGYIKSQAPLWRRYQAFVKMLFKYQKMPKFSKLHEGRKIKVGMSDDRVSQIKRMLKFFGDYPKSASTSSNYYDKTTAKAVRSFRSRFKLLPGDYVDNKMIYYLNRSKWEYIKQIKTNIEKLKLYPHSFESEYIEVNVPEYKMRLYSRGRTIFDSDVVVGRIDRPTPIFSAKMSYMVLNPTWTIPDNLIKKDLIPMLKKNPNYLQEHNIHVYQGKKEVEPNFEELFSYEHSSKRVPYRFVQFPSASNALGRVKFMFPNRYAVYLHDTDNRDLFKYRYRVFSSGCMRVQKPFDFMYELLRYAKGSYSRQKIQSIFDSNKPTTIRLRKKLPVHILYFTINKVGKKEYFLYDIYLYDQIIWESMAGHKKSSFRVPKNRLDPLRKPKKRKKFIF